jgi:hypothetical protein
VEDYVWFWRCSEKFGNNVDNIPVGDADWLMIHVDVDWCWVARGSRYQGRSGGSNLPRRVPGESVKKRLDIVSDLIVCLLEIVPVERNLDGMKNHSLLIHASHLDPQHAQRLVTPVSGETKSCQLGRGGAVEGVSLGCTLPRGCSGVIEERAQEPTERAESIHGKKQPAQRVEAILPHHLITTLNSHQSQ